MLRLLLLAGALALAPLPAAAECVTRPAVQAWLGENAPSARPRLLGGVEAQAFLAAYNSMPPITAIAADEILLVELPGEAGNTRIALFAGGCMARGGRMPAALVQRILGEIERSGA